MAVVLNTSITMDDTLIHLLVQNFNTDDEKLFVNSFKMYLEHGDDDTKFIISLDDIWQWLGYKKIQDVRLLLIKHFVENSHYILLTQDRKQKSNTENRGGHNKQVIMLNVNTFKKLCMKANTSRANDICDYYVKMENIMHKYMKQKLIESQNLKIKYQEEIKNNDEKLAMDRHNFLVKTYNHKKLVYIMRMCTFEDGSYIIKIGKTTNIKERLEKIRAEYKSKPVVIDIYESENPEKFESFLHRHPEILKHKYSQPINDTKVSTECYLIKNEKKYKAIIAIMDRHSFEFQKDKDLLRLQIENNKVNMIRDFMSMSAGEKVLTCMVMGNLENLSITTQEPQIVKEEKEEKDDEQEKTPTTIIDKDSNTCPTCGQKKPVIKLPTVKKSVSQGPYVQMYEKEDNKKLVRVFNNITDVTREFPNMNNTHLKYVVRHRLVYNEYRWHFVNRLDDPNKIYDIGETTRSHQNNTDLICMVDKEKSKIEKVYRLQKDAAADIGQHTSAMSSSIRFGSLLNDKYWIMWNTLSNEMKDAYLANNELPKKEPNKRSMQIQQLDPHTREIIATFDSMTTAVKYVCTSQKSIKKAIANNVVCSGYRWRLLEKKE